MQQPQSCNRLAEHFWVIKEVLVQTKSKSDDPRNRSRHLPEMHKWNSFFFFFHFEKHQIIMSHPYLSHGKISHLQCLLMKSLHGLSPPGQLILKGHTKIGKFSNFIIINIFSLAAKRNRPHYY